MSSRRSGSGGRRQHGRHARGRQAVTPPSREHDWRDAAQHGSIPARSNPQAQVVPQAPQRDPDRLPATGAWYFVIAVLSGGFLAWVPFVHAAQRTGLRRARVLAASYAGTATALVVLPSAVPIETVPALGALYTVALLGQIGMSLVHLESVRRRVYERKPEPMPDPAIRAALAARKRRAEARELAASDALLARELRIGRHDKQSRYDDGGLVDMNSAPAAVIADVCGLDKQSAQRIVDVRERIGTFSNVEEILVLADVPVSAWPRVTDRAILLE